MSPYLETTTARTPDQVGTLILTTTYHRVRKDGAGGYIVVRQSSGRECYIQPGDDAATFSDQLWSIEERSDLPPAAIDRFLAEHFE